MPYILEIVKGSLAERGDYRDSYWDFDDADSVKFDIQEVKG